MTCTIGLTLGLWASVSFFDFLEKFPVFFFFSCCCFVFVWEMAVAQYERYSVSRWDARRAPCRSFLLLFFLSLSYLWKVSTERHRVERPHTAELHGTFQRRFFFFFKPSFVLWPPKIWFKSFSVWSTREATTTTTTTKIENQRYARISKNTKSWNTFETFLIRLHSPSQKKGL